MANDNAVIEYESGQNAEALEAMTTTDNTVFAASFKPLSGKSGFEPMIAPAGVVNGGVMTASATANTVSVAELVVSLAEATGADSNGRLTVAAADVLCARPTSTHLIYSITVDNAGALVAVAGSESTSFSETRGAAGGPPYIPVDSIEVGQVRYSSSTSGVLTSAEIKQVPGLHQELADFPIYTLNSVKGEITFGVALPAIHTGDVPKKVYISGFTPIFAEVPDGTDWSPSEETHSVSSTQVYGRVINSTSKSLDQASFTCPNLKDGITDQILSAVGDNIWVRFKQDRNRLPNQLTQGILGVKRGFSADGNPSGSFTLSSQSKTEDYAS